MKAKTTWLIGLLIALMMVLTAVPAFAQEEQQPVEPVNEDVNVEAQADTEPNFITASTFKAEKPRVYVGDKLKFTVTFTTDTKTTGNLPYTFTMKDISDKTKVKPFNDRTLGKIQPGAIPDTNSISYETSEIKSAELVGTHTFELYGTPNGGTETDLKKSVTVEIKPALAARQTGYNLKEGSEYLLKGEIGKEMPLSAFVEENTGYAPYTYKWQKSLNKPGASSNDPTSNDWETFATGASAGYTLKYGDDDYQIRCVVTDNNNTSIVAQVETATSGQYAVTLKTDSKDTITITDPEQDSTVTLVEGQTFSTSVTATGGTTEGQYNYQWKKGSEDVGENQNRYSKSVTKDDAGLYKCVVTDKTYPDKINATSKTTRLNVVSAPKFSISSNKGEKKGDTAATWAGEGALPTTDGEGTLYLSSTDAQNGVTLSLNVTGDLSDSNKSYSWGGNVPVGQSNKPVTIKPVTAGDYTVTLQYPTYLLNPATYTLHVVLTGGSISATGDGITKQANGKLTSPEYTMHLPSGTAFNTNPTAAEILEWVKNEPEGLTIEQKDVSVTANKNAVTFKFSGTATQIPYVADMQVEIPKEKVTPQPATDVIFPVSSAYGFQITDTLSVIDLAVDVSPETSEHIYDGDTIAARIIKNDPNAPDIGPVSNIHYLDEATFIKIANDNPTKTIDEINTLRYNASKTTAPKDAGEYYVWCDVGRSTAYPADAKKLGPLSFTISKADNTTMFNKSEGKGYDTYFTWTKAKKFNNSVQYADVAFKSGLTNKGKIKEVKYFNESGVETIPKQVGKYDIVVTTVADGEKNPCSNVVAGTYTIGTFEITEKDPVPETKKDPTKDLYEMSPTSATADGKEHSTTVSVKDDYSDAGEVTATKYYDENGKKLSGKPSKAGEYTVKVDTEETDTYKAGKDLEIGTFTIKGATPTASMYTMDPKSGSSVTANGKGQGVKVTAKDPDTAGEATVKYYDKDGKAVSGQPVKAGVYTVRIDTAASDYYAAGKDIAMGTFEIKQGTPTKAMNLYKVDPAQNNYTGKANPTKVVPTGDNGAGEVEAIHYTKKAVSTQADTDAPVAVGTYTVSVDTKESDTFKAVKGLEVGEYQIVDQGIFIRAHVQNIGWMQLYELEPGTEKTVGTEGQSLRSEAIDIAVPAGYTVEGFAHIENKGDTDCRIVSPNEADYPAGVPAGYTVYRFGSTGQGLRLEAIQVNLKDASSTTMAQIQYCVHVQNIGWLGYVNNNTFTGTRGHGLRLEALRFAYSNK